MRKKLLITVLSMAHIVLLSNCNTDMDIRNDNDPNTKRFIATSSDFADLLGGTFLEYWSAWEKSYPSVATAALPDILTSSWGCWGRRDLSSEPRIPFNNDPAYAYNDVVETPWYGTYRALSAVADVALGLQEGRDFDHETHGFDNNAAWAYIRFMQGVCHGSLGLFFDKAFILDESTDLEALLPSPQFASRNEMVDRAIEYLEEAITLSGESFTLPSKWINGLSPTNDDIMRWSHSLIARFEAQRGRTEEESAASDWNRVLEHVEQGIVVDMAPEGDDKIWWKRTIERAGFQTWQRADMKLIGQTDVSGNYQAWLDTPNDDRNAIEVFPQDRRITGSVDDAESDGLYFIYAGHSPFRSNRGTYHHSYYGWSRYNYHKNPAVGPMPWITVVEMDMLKAEALLELKPAGYKAEVANLINKTRVGNGQMDPLDGSESEEELWKWMIYEKRIEDGMHHSAGAWYDMRRWDKKTEAYIGWPPGHLRSFPVPGKELELLQLGSYSFGGPDLPATKLGRHTIDADYIAHLRKDLERRNRIDRESAKELK